MIVCMCINMCWVWIPSGLISYPAPQSHKKRCLLLFISFLFLHDYCYISVGNYYSSRLFFRPR